MNICQVVPRCETRPYAAAVVFESELPNVPSSTCIDLYICVGGQYYALYDWLFCGPIGKNSFVSCNIV